MKDRLVSILLLVVLALSVGLVGCAGDYTLEVTEYTLTLSGTDGGNACVPNLGCTCGGGTESSGGLTVPQECVCAEGKEVGIEASPEPGYRFVGWTGDVNTIADVNAAETTIIMNDNYSIVANFHKIPVTCYILTVAVNGSGSTSPSVGQHTYAAGTLVSITATPAAGFWFIGWTGDVDTIALVSAATTMVTMNANYSITANFEEGVATFPGPDVGTTLRGPINEAGYIRPSDLQRHSFFSGIT